MSRGCATNGGPNAVTTRRNDTATDRVRRSSAKMGSSQMPRSQAVWPGMTILRARSSRMPEPSAAMITPSAAVTPPLP